MEKAYDLIITKGFLNWFNSVEKNELSGDELKIYNAFEAITFLTREQTEIGIKKGLEFISSCEKEKLQSAVAKIFLYKVHMGTFEKTDINALEIFKDILI